MYRDILLITNGDRKGLWRHIVGPSDKADEGAWSTGNGWAAYGMARVRATIVGWEKGREIMREEVSDGRKCSLRYNHTLCLALMSFETLREGGDTC